MNQFQKSVLVLRSILLGLVCSGFSFAQSEEPVSSDQIYDDAKCIMVFHPQRVAEHLDEKTSDKLDVIFKWLKANAKLDAEKATEVAIQFGDDGNDPEDTIGFLFRFSEEIDQQAIESLADLASLDKRTHEGIDYYGSDREPGYYFADDTLLIAERQRVKRAIEADAGMPGKRKIVRKLTSDDDLSAFVELDDEDFNDFFVEMMGDSPWQDTECFQSIANSAKSAHLVVRFDDGTPLALMLEASSPDEVEALRDAADELVESTKGAIEEMRDELDNAPGEIGGKAAELIDALDELIELAEVSVDGTTVTIKIEKMGGAKNVVARFVETMSATVQFFGG